MYENSWPTYSRTRGIQFVKPLDLLMPKETGTDLYRRIHQKKGLEEVPVIVISGLPGRHLAVSKSVPVFDKPIDETRLLEEVKKAIG